MQQVRWGLIGCGDIARKRVAPALRDAPNSELTAVSRRQSDLAESCGQELGARKHYADWHDMVADPEIDAVYIATPVHVHAEQAIAAAEAGKQVLCEKPMALNVAECDRMIAACQKEGVKLGIAYYRRLYPVIRRIRSLLDTAAVGRAIIAQVNAFERFNPQPGEPRHWFLQKRQAGGGPMMDFGSHRIELLLNLLGPIRGTQAFADKTLFEREVEDTSGAFLHFDSGARASLIVTHAAFESQDTLDIFGSEGSLHVPVLNAGDLTIKTGDGERLERLPPHANLHQPLVEDFVAAVLEDLEPAVGGGVGREVQRVEEMIYADAATESWARPGQAAKA